MREAAAPTSLREGGEGPAASAFRPQVPRVQGSDLGSRASFTPEVGCVAGHFEKLAQPLACHNFLDSAVGLVHLGAGPWPLVGTRPARPSTPGTLCEKEPTPAAAAFRHVWVPVFFKTFTISTLKKQ